MEKSKLIELYTACKGMDLTFSEDFNSGGTYPVILLRHDIDDDLNRAVLNAELQEEIGVKATYFILNTAPYYNVNNSIMWNKIHYIQSMGHEIGWHNNILAQYKSEANAEKIKEILKPFADNGIEIRGSVSHGDPLCRELGFINYEIFEGCKRSGGNFPEPKFDWERIPMAEVGLEWEGYFTNRDLYFSESGGEWGASGFPDVSDKSKRIQILIHCQWWAL